MARARFWRRLHLLRGGLHALDAGGPPFAKRGKCIQGLEESKPLITNGVNECNGIGGVDGLHGLGADGAIILDATGPLKGLGGPVGPLLTAKSITA